MNTRADVLVLLDNTGIDLEFYILDGIGGRQWVATVHREHIAKLRTALTSEASIIADAARYRWLRDKYYDHDGDPPMMMHDKGIDYCLKYGKHLDAAIDEAIRKLGEGHGK